MANSVTTLSYCENCNTPTFPGMPCKKCSIKLKNEKPKMDYTCCVIENGIRCMSTQNPIRCNHGHEPPMFWCLKHYEQRRKKSDVDLEVERRAKELEDDAKKIGISNYDYFQYVFGKEDTGDKKKYIENIKNILKKQNPLLVNLDDNAKSRAN